MLLISALFTYFVVLAAKGDPNAGRMLWTMGFSLLFSFSLLIIIHELMHAMAFWLSGKRKIKFGVIIKQFIFYVQATNQVLSAKEFYVVALAPFVLINLVTLPFIVVDLMSVSGIFALTIACTHTLFCTGDMALVSYFLKHNTHGMFTYDSETEKTTYYYIKKPAIRNIP